MKTLPPQPLKDKDYAKLRSDVLSLLYALIYGPVRKIAEDANKAVEMPKVEMRNAGDADPLIAALRRGQVQYKAGVFTGKFSRAISAALRRIGAKFNGTSGDYRIDDSLLPSDVRTAAFMYEAAARAAHDLIDRSLQDAYSKVEKFVDGYALDTDSTADNVAGGFSAAAEAMRVRPELTEESMAALREQYSENLKLSIRGFAEREILALRSDVQDNAERGYRFDRLARIIRDRFQVSEAKAEFLARQETALFMSQFRRRQFSEAGVTQYIWRTAGDERVRGPHKHLEGKVFSYTNPPIVDPATGRRRNPGEDYGCRCVDEPIVDFNVGD